MRFRPTIIMLVLVSILGGFIYFFERDLPDAMQRRSMTSKMIQFPPQDLSYVQLHLPNEVHFEFNLVNQHWVPLYPEAFSLHEAKFITFLSKLWDANKETLIDLSGTSSPEEHLNLYGLSNPKAVIEYGNDLEKHQLLIGNPTDFGDGVYVKFSDQPQVIKADNRWLRYLPATKNDWRTSLIFNQPEANWQSIRINHWGGLIELRRNRSGIWRMEQPKQVGVDRQQLKRFMNQFTSLRNEGYVEGRFDDPTFGFLDPGAYLKIVQAPGDPPTTLRIGSILEDQPNVCYGYLEPSDTLLLLPVAFKKSLEGISANRLARKDIFSGWSEDIEQISRKGNNLGLAISKTNHLWEITTPFQAPADGDTVDELLYQLEKIEVQEFITPLPGMGDVTSTNYIPVWLSLELKTKSGELREVSFHRKNESETFVHVPKQRIWALADNATLSPLLKPSSAFLNRKALNINTSTLIRLTLYTSEIEYSFVREEPQSDWRLVIDKERYGKVNEVLLSSFLEKLSPLLVKTWLSEEAFSDTREVIETPDIRIGLGFSGEDVLANTLLLKDVSGRYTGVRLGIERAFILEREMGSQLYRLIEQLTNQQP